MTSITSQWSSSNLKTAMTRRKPLLQSTRDSNFEAIYENEGESSSLDVGLKRSLSAADLIFYGVGGSIGAGIYGLVGIGAEIAGPGIALSFFACGVACIFTSLAYAEFAARIPVAGSAYVYAYVAFGELCGWLVGWFLTLGYGFTAAVVARAWGEYLASFLQNMTKTISLEYLTKLPIPFIAPDYTCSPLSMVIIAICTLVLVTGAKESSHFNNAMTLLNVSILAFVVFAGVGTDSVVLDNLEPFLPEGLAGVARGAGFVFFAFIGFDMVACLSEEVKQPERNMPIGIVGSLLICTAIYVTVSLAVIGMAPISLLGKDVPITNALWANACCTHEQQLLPDAAEQCLDSTCTPPIHRLLVFGGNVVSFGSIFGLTSGTFTSLMGQPRIFYRMAQDGLLFEIFARVDPTTHVPTAGIVITGVVTALLACLIQLEALANLISLGTLMVFTFVDAGVIILRLSGPGLAVSHSSSKPVLCTVLFTTSASLGFVAMSNEWHGTIPMLCLAISVVSALVIFRIPNSPPPDTFSCPLVPLVPLIGITSNAYMMGSLPIVSWAFALVWLFLGTAVYFFYGIRHSKLGKISVPAADLSPLKEETTLLWSPSDLSTGYSGIADEEVSLQPLHVKRSDTQDTID